MLKLYQETCEILKLFHKAETALLKLDLSTQPSASVEMTMGQPLALVEMTAGLPSAAIGIANVHDVISSEHSESRNLNKEKQHMQTKRIIKLVIRDFIDQELFTLNGLAHELGVPLDSLCELYINEQREPSCSVAIKLLQLHAQMFPALYA